MGLFGKKKTEKVEVSSLVKILGSGCAKCNTLEDNTVEALKMLGKEMPVEHVTDFSKIAAYGVMTTPALVYDQKVLIAGRVAKAEEIAELTAKNEKLNKDYLLLMADFDNYRKRTLKEKADLLKSGGEDCLKNILPIVDDFERGLMAIGESADVDAVKEGMTLIYNKFKNYLNQHGIKEIPTTGEDFNTEYHEAVTMYPAPQPELKGKVIDCVQKGYTMNDKVIRFAKVVVGE